MVGCEALLELSWNAPRAKYTKVYNREPEVPPGSQGYSDKCGKVQTFQKFYPIRSPIFANIVAQERLRCFGIQKWSNFSVIFYKLFLTWAIFSDFIDVSTGRRTHISILFAELFTISLQGRKKDFSIMPILKIVHESVIKRPNSLASKSYTTILWNQSKF